MAVNLDNAYNKLAGVLAFKLAQNLPVLLNTEQQVSKEVFESGRGANGLTMNYVLPDYGKVGTGPVIDDAQMDYTAGTVPVTLRQYNIPFSAGQYSATYPDAGFTNVGGTVQTRNMLLDMEKQVKMPLGANLASQLQKRTITAGMRGAGFAAVVTKTELDSGSKTLWDAFSEATAAIRNARADDEVFGVVSPQGAAKAARGAANLFHPGDQISKLWTKCELGEFTTAKWFTSADVPVFELAADDDPCAFSSVVYDPTNPGVVTVSAAGGAVKAGTPFTIAGINQVDPLGNDTGNAFVFVVQEDAESGATELKIQRLYTKGALKNVNRLPGHTQGWDETTSGDTYSDASTALLTAGKRYATGLVWAKPGLATAWGQMDNLDGANNFSFNANGLVFYGASFADIMKRRNIWRLDALKGETVTLNNWVSSIFVGLN